MVEWLIGFVQPGVLIQLARLLDLFPADVLTQSVQDACRSLPGNHQQGADDNQDSCASHGRGGARKGQAGTVEK
jgi:hypothetical protein